jgi:hypothetical protein
MNKNIQETTYELYVIPKLMKSIQHVFLFFMWNDISVVTLNRTFTQVFHEYSMFAVGFHLILLK